MSVTSQGHVLLSSINQFYLLGWGGIIPIGEKIAGSISAFTYSPDGYLMVIHDNELCYIDSADHLASLYELPAAGMGISSGEKVVYLYDRSTTKKSHALYILSKGHKYAKLLEITTPIISVLETGNTLLFSTENKILSVNLMNNELKTLVALPQKENRILSIAADTSGGIIYFSSQDALYALNDSAAVCISDKFGGILQYFNKGLLVFKPERKFLIHMNFKVAGSPVDQVNEIIPQSDRQIDVLTNATIVDLVKRQLSDEIIITIINHSVVDFNLSVESMIELSDQQVSSKVIMAMRQAMKRQILNQ
jgi:hypothetical protein